MAIETTGDYPPIVVFPEGGTSNGKYLITFKKGAFYGLRAVQPIVLKYEWEHFSPAYDLLPISVTLIMSLSFPWYTCTMKILPPMLPNEYLYKEHENKG